jgi:hypothetical protein
LRKNARLISALHIRDMHDRKTVILLAKHVYASTSQQHYGLYVCISGEGARIIYDLQPIDMHMMRVQPRMTLVTAFCPLYDMSTLCGNHS